MESIDERIEAENIQPERWYKTPLVAQIMSNVLGIEYTTTNVRYYLTNAVVKMVGKQLGRKWVVQGKEIINYLKIMEQ